MAAPPQFDRTPKMRPEPVEGRASTSSALIPAQGAPVGGPQLRVRWDRVSVLFALVAVLAVVITHAVVVAIRGNVRTPNTRPATIETAAAPPAVHQQRCPQPARGVIRTAPMMDGETGESQRTVALTFDDGPGPATPEVLDVLRQHGVPAAFFVVGQKAAAAPEMLHRIVAEGHAIGDHSWSHRIPSAKAGWRTRTLAREIKQTRQVITSTTGRAPCLFRPPGGIVKGAVRVTRDANLSMILWSVDTRDWAAPPNKKFASVIQKRAAVGLKEQHPVILLHDGGGNRTATVAALPGIINEYRSDGYRFVTWDRNQLISRASGR